VQKGIADFEGQLLQKFRGEEENCKVREKEILISDA